MRRGAISEAVSRPKSDPGHFTVAYPRRRNSTLTGTTHHLGPAASPTLLYGRCLNLKTQPLFDRWRTPGPSGASLIWCPHRLPRIMLVGPAHLDVWFGAKVHLYLTKLPGLDGHSARASLSLAENADDDWTAEIVPKSQATLGGVAASHIQVEGCREDDLKLGRTNLTFRVPKPNITCSDAFLT